MKDPAFLFYSNDFYEGTRMMLPEERACYIDLMIYQHQRGYIPDDPKRLALYCSGVSEATLKGVLEAKFKHSDKGWYNERLFEIMEDRKAYSSKQSENGQVGQFFKKTKKCLKANEYKDLIAYIYSDEYGKDTLISDLKKYKTFEATLKALLKASLKHLEDVNVNENEIIINKELSDFDKVIEEWYQYKKEKGQSYKSQIGKTKFVNKLNELSGGNADIARRVIEQSMANNWAGIFELKQNVSSTQKVSETIYKEF